MRSRPPGRGSQDQTGDREATATFPVRLICDNPTCPKMIPKRAMVNPMINATTAIEFVPLDAESKSDGAVRGESVGCRGCSRRSDRSAGRRGLWAMGWVVRWCRSCTPDLPYVEDGCDCQGDEEQQE